MPGESDKVLMGTDELALRNRLGDDGYEATVKRAATRAVLEDGLLRSSVDQSQATAKLTKAQVAYVEAKRGFWSMLSLAVLAGTCCGVVEFVRWVVR